jgi:hypothetical protein
MQLITLVDKMLSPPHTEPQLPDGLPREQYQRTYVLLPPGADSDWATIVVDATWDSERFTLGGSADDAGIGALEYKRVIAVNPDRWGSDLELFFEEYYPGVIYEPIYADSPEELFDILVGDPTDPTDPGDSFPIRGVHDIEGARWMVESGLDGWITVPIYLGTNAVVLDYRHLEEAGIRVVVNLRYSYAVDDGGMGTMPGPEYLSQFESACLETMQKSQGIWGYCYCNEFNNPREYPLAFELTPSYYVGSYNRVSENRSPGVRFGPGSIDPFNPGWGDWRQAWGAALDVMGDVDFLAMHSYDHGINANPDMMFGDEPLQGVYYNLRVLESQKEVVPLYMRDLPIVVTESNHGADGSSWGSYSGEWVQRALDYFRSQEVAGVTFFRYNYNDDRWRFSDHPEVLEAIKNG